MRDFHWSVLFLYFHNASESVLFSSQCQWVCPFFSHAFFFTMPMSLSFFRTAPSCYLASWRHLSPTSVMRASTDDVALKFFRTWMYVATTLTQNAGSTQCAGRHFLRPPNTSRYSKSLIRSGLTRLLTKVHLMEIIEGIFGLVLNYVRFCYTTRLLVSSTITTVTQYVKYRVVANIVGFSKPEYLKKSVSKLIWSLARNCYQNLTHFLEQNADLWADIWNPRPKSEAWRETITKILHGAARERLPCSAARRSPWIHWQWIPTSSVRSTCSGVG